MADGENMLALVEHGFQHRVCAGRYSMLGHTRALERAMDCIETVKIIRTYPEVNLRCNQRKVLESMSLYYTVLFLRGIPDMLTITFLFSGRTGAPEMK